MQDSDLSKPIEGVQDSFEMVQEKLNAWLETAVALLPNLVVAILVILIFLLLSRLARKLIQRFLDKLTGSQAIARLLSTLGGIAVISIGIFIALGVWMTVANSSRPSWDPMTLDQDATPLRWYNLLEHEPVRLWPSGWDTARVSYNPELEDVMVEEPDIVLLRQGTTNSADYRLQVEVSKTALTGSAGLFWGYGVHPELKQQQFQAVYIRSYHDGKGKLITELTREISTMSKGFPNARPMLDTSYVALQPVSFSGKGVLDLEVRRGVVQRIRWRGADCEDLIVFDEPGTDHNAGDFGIVGRHGATLFRDARFQLFN